MKKEQELKEIIKEAILEAFAEMYGVATTDEPAVPELQPEDESGKGGGSAESSGGTPNNGRPKPDVGVGTFNIDRQ